MSATYWLSRVPLALALAGLVAGCSGAPPTIDPTYNIAGTVTVDGAGLAGVTVSLGGGRQTVTGAGGAYAFAGLAAGSYTVTPSLAGCEFEPASRQVTLGPTTAASFTADLIAPVLSSPQVSIEVVEDVPTLNGSVTVGFEGPGGLEVIFRVVSPSGSETDVPATTAGDGLYTASHALAEVEGGGYSVTIAARSALDSDCIAEAAVPNVLLVPPGLPE